MSENRYMIGDVECFVTFYKENVVNMKGQCSVRIGEKEFVIPTKLLELIAEPAP